MSCLKEPQVYEEISELTKLGLMSQENRITPTADIKELIKFTLLRCKTLVKRDDAARQLKGIFCILGIE